MYYNSDTIIFLNKEWLKASEAKTDLYSQTLHYGNGVFEGIRSYDTPNGTKIFKAKEHYERLIYSAEKMHIKVDYSVKELTDYTYQLLEKNNLKNAYIRPLIYVGANMGLTTPDETYVMLSTWEWGRYLGNDLLKAMISSYQRPNPKSCHIEAKVCGHYINSILATSEAKAKGFGEPILLDSNGYIAEGGGSNFFYEKSGKFFTPPIGNILPGITRATVIDIADKFGYEVKTEHFTFDDLKNIKPDIAFFTGTAAEVAGIRSIDDFVFDAVWEDTLSYKIAQEYKKITTG
ncbi:MAG: branched-chain amino acid transaminase, partial [Candidatus Sericytochromatia bacterium]|nr:branched-chain amino acid transaminase [Candidatus Sericytochromatia bacterium]